MQARLKLSTEGCYYHLFNRISGTKTDLPFTDVDKEYGFRLLQNLCEYFLIEVISAAWMGNHFHLVVYAPGPDELPPLETIAKRHNNYYKKMRKTFKYGPRLPQINPQNPQQCRETGLRMTDISRFMAAYQQRFTQVFNESRDRVGQLWSGRFKSVILDKLNALEACVLYVELNPVRSGLTAAASDYRFTTWGRYCGSGKHMFHDNFVKHLKPHCYPGDKEMTDAELYAFFSGELTRITAAETGLESDEIHAAAASARRKESMPIRFLRRTRHFTDGAILGSKLYIREIGIHFEDPTKVDKKQFARGQSPTGPTIYSFRKLQP